MSAKEKFAAKTSLAVSSIEFCQAIFDEGDVREGLRGGRGHGAMIPPCQIIFPEDFFLNRFTFVLGI